MGETRNEYRLLLGKRPLGRPRHRWVDNIRMDLGEVESSCEFGIEPSGSMKCWETIEWPLV
jgi:hypothetical protein